MCHSPAEAKAVVLKKIAVQNSLQISKVYRQKKYLFVNNYFEDKHDVQDKHDKV